MKVEVSVPEVIGLFKEIQEQPEKLFEMIRVDVRETVGQYFLEGDTWIGTYHPKFDPTDERIAKL